MKRLYMLLVILVSMPLVFSSAIAANNKGKKADDDGCTMLTKPGYYEEYNTPSNPGPNRAFNSSWKVKTEKDKKDKKDKNK